MADADRVDVSLPELRALLREVIDAVPMRQVPEELVRRLCGGARVPGVASRKLPEEAYEAAARARERLARKRRRKAG